MKKIRLKKITPLANSIVTTADRYENVIENGLIRADVEGVLKPVQRIVEVGTYVKDVKVGDLVSLNYNAYAYTKQVPSVRNDEKDQIHYADVGYHIPEIEIDGAPHLFLQASDVSFIIEDYEEVEDSSPLVTVKNKIIHNSHI